MGGKNKKIFAVYFSLIIIMLKFFKDKYFAVDKGTAISVNFTPLKNYHAYQVWGSRKLRDFLQTNH